MALLNELFGVPPQIDPTMVAPARRAAPAPAPAAAPVFADNGIGGADVLGAILQGMGGIAAPLGNLVAGQGQRERQNQQRTDIYNWLVTQKDPNDPSRTITPDMAKIIVTNEAIAKEYLPRILGTKHGTEAATKGAPSGYMWNDPNDPSKGVSVMPGFKEKPDPIETMTRREEVKADNKQIAEARKEANISRETLDKLAQLRAARAGVSYEGGVAPEWRTTLGKWLPDSPIPGVGLPFIPSQEEAGKAEQIGSLATDIQLQFTQKTKGAISNREMELFGAATPGLTMSDAGANRVIDGFEAGSLRLREKPKFYEAYRKANGSLDGADEAWDNFVEERPILEDDGTGGFTVNRENVGAWKQYASRGGDPGISAQGGSPASPAARPDGARQAPDGNWYIPDPNRQGKFLRVVE